MPRPLNPSLEVLFAPDEIAVLERRDLSGTACVVLDVLRATSSMITALANGATAIGPVSDIAAALAWRQREPSVLLAGEREGLRIRAGLTGGVDFDLGNSPREFTADRVRGRTIVMTTTNGTRALRACAGAQHVAVGAFLNIGAVVDWVRTNASGEVLLVCSGTLTQASFEDALAAGVLADRLWPGYGGDAMSDSAQVARELYLRHAMDLVGAFRLARNGRRLLARPELAGDVEICAAVDRYAFAPTLRPDGTVRRGAAALG